MQGQWRRFWKFYSSADTIYQAHSPMVYDMIRTTMEGGCSETDLAQVRNYSRSWFQKEDKLQWQDLGASSSQKPLTMGRRARRVSTTTRKGKRLYNLAQWSGATRVLELGTAFGVGTYWLLLGAPYARVDTIEGQSTVHKIVAPELSRISSRVRCHLGSFEEILEGTLGGEKYDFVFVDGGHTEELCRHHWQLLQDHLKERCVVVFDDIHWSGGMSSFWRKPSLSSAQPEYWIDIYDYGICLRDPSLRHRHRQAFVSRWWKPWRITL